MFRLHIFNSNIYSQVKNYLNLTLFNRTSFPRVGERATKDFSHVHSNSSPLHWENGRLCWQCQLTVRALTSLYCRWRFSLDTTGCKALLSGVRNPIGTGLEHLFYTVTLEDCMSSLWSFAQSFSYCFLSSVPILFPSDGSGKPNECSLVVVQHR